jgi:ADP-ribose pyrophosphatase YjhB (NUDIX family)
MNESDVIVPLDWIALSRELKSLAEAGLRYSESSYDRERYQRLHELASLPLQAAAPDFQWPQEFGYATPKVDVRAAVIDDQNRILLVQEVSSGEWTMPGGWADLNFSPAENAVKETREESGIDVEVVKLIACWDKDKQNHPRQPEHIYKLVFLCRIIGGTLATSHETSGADFYHIDHLPPLCPHRAAQHYLDLAWQHAADRSLPTSFD